MRKPDLDETIIGLCESLKSAMEPEPAVRAIFLCGSHAVGTASADSDIDFTVLVDGPESVAHAKQRLAEVFEETGEEHCVPQYVHEGKRLSICIFPKCDVDSWMADVYASVENLLGSQAALQHKIVEALVILDPGDLLGGYQDRLRDYPDLLAEEVASKAVDYLQSEYLDDWGFRGTFHFSYCLSDILEHVGQALYAQNKRLFMPPCKRWPDELRELRPNLEDELLRLVSVSHDGNLDPQRQALEAIIRKLR